MTSMKSIISFLFTFFLFSFCLKSQTVDSVKVVQAGDYIKITYKILNSNKNQIFKVNVQCSVNGGLMGDIKSYSGDAGDGIIGGKLEYMVLWDVFKEVDDISSVEFKVRAELIKGWSTKLRPVNLTGWDKKKVYVMLIYQNHGPKFGCRIGYFGNWGVAAEFATGKMAPVREGFTVSSDLLPSKTYFNIDLVKRVINQDGFQCHLFMGVSETPNIFANNQDLNDYQVIYLTGIHLGLSFAMQRVVFFLGGEGMPAFGKTEKGNNLMSITNDTYVDLGFGLRF
jgi:hypothetical protein